ncbi:hypothetical protein H0H92_005978 [Tricholoma furcatifolium]|nr:hypothetical protein H0H92_005978 [Tricholoma furcatifolium]
MTSNVLQDTLPTSPPSAGPRFRPYASPNHHVTKGRYITSNDPRGYIPVYEYPLNGQWIMMDIDDGYILWTGIWKALGNSKADIVKMIDSQPDLAPLIRRVRGGYLKIQGTWMPYEVRLIYTVPSPTFPSTCLTPDQPGYGQVVASGHNRRRPRRNTHATSSLNPPREPWTVVTPHDSGNSHQPPPSQYVHTAFYPPNRDVHFHHSFQDAAASSVYNGRSSPEDPASPASTSRNSFRYSPYVSHAPHPNRRTSVEGRRDLALDIPSLSLRDNGAHPSRSAPHAPEMEQITLPPIHAPDCAGESRSPYALPPISAMEDLRGVHANDSAAVLRRLKAEDSSTIDTYRRPDDWRRHSYSSQTLRPDDHDSRSRAVHASYTSRSYPDHTYRSRSSSSSSEGYQPQHGSDLSLSVHSDASHSTCDPSPVSPTTPRSATSGPIALPLTTAPSGKDYERYNAPVVQRVADWPGTDHRGHDDIRVSDVRFGARRHSDHEPDTRPHRPW